MEWLNSTSLIIGLFATLIGIVVIFVNATGKLTKAITSLEVTMKHVVQHSENQERVAEIHADRLRLIDLSIAGIVGRLNSVEDKLKILWDAYSRE